MPNPFDSPQNFIVPTAPVGTSNNQAASTAFVQSAISGAVFRTKATAQAASISALAQTVATAGYAVAGDGGGATYARVNSLTYLTYGFQSADGAFWQYVPEAIGWNAKVAGLVADGVTDDTVNLKNALLPFQRSNVIFGGGNLTGRLILPPSSIAVTSAIIYAGNSSAALHLLGQSVGNDGGNISTCLLYKGTSTYPSMFLLYGANASLIEQVNFDAQTFAGTSGINNCVHVTADNSYLDALTSGVTAGAAQTFNVTSTSHLAAGVALGVGAGTANFEIVYIINVTGGSTFTADCVNSHSTSEVVGGGLPTNDITFQTCTFAVSPPFFNNQGAGVFVGNPITITPQASQVALINCTMTGGVYLGVVSITAASPAVVTDTAHGMKTGTAIQFSLVGGATLPTGLDANLTYYVKSPATNSYNLSLTKGGANVNTSGSPSSGTVNRVAVSYSGFRTNTGGNVKNFLLNNCIITHLQYGIAGETMSGSVEIFYPTFAGNFIADILANGASNLHVLSAESESSGQAFLLGSSVGNNSEGATLEENSYQSGLPADGYVINWGGNLTLLNNSFFSQSPSGSTNFQVCPKIKVTGGISTTPPPTTLLPGAISSFGNFFQWGGPTGLITNSVFYDGSNNPWDFGTGPTSTEWRIIQVGDYGSNGWIQNRIGELSISVGALSQQTTGAGVTVNTNGVVGQFTQSYTVPFGTFQAASLNVTVTIGSIPPHTTIAGIILDVTTPFASTGATSITLKAGSNNISTTNFILSFDAKTAAVVKGPANADLGVSLASGTRPAPLGYSSTGAWTTGGEHITLTMGSDVNTSNLTAGSVTMYVTYIKFR